MKFCGLYECHVACRHLPGCVHDYRERTGRGPAPISKWRDPAVFAGLVIAMGVVVAVIRLLKGG